MTKFVLPLIATLLLSANVLADDAVVCYEFDETTGTVARDSCGVTNGTLTGGPAYSTNLPNPKLSNIRSLTFDKVDDRVNIGQTAPLDDLTTKTFTFWIYPISQGESSFGTLISACCTSSAWYIQQCNSDASECPATASTFVFRQVFSVATGEWYAPANTIVLNTWQHIAVVYNNSSTANDPIFYKNGAVITTTEVLTPNGTRNTDATQDKLIGNVDALDSTFEGQIDDVRIYSRALSISEIQGLANGRSFYKTKVRVG